MVEEEINPRVAFLAQADSDGGGHFEKRKQIAQLAEPDDEVVVKALMAHRADVDRLAEAKGVQRQGRAPAVKVLGVSGQNLTFLGLDQVAPELGRVEVAGGKCALKREMILFPGGERVELEHFHAENVCQIVRVTIVGRDVVLVHQAGVKGAHQRAAVLNVELEQVRFAAGQQFERRGNDQFVSREI